MKKFWLALVAVLIFSTVLLSSCVDIPDDSSSSQSSQDSSSSEESSSNEDSSSGEAHEHEFVVDILVNGDDAWTDATCTEFGTIIYVCECGEIAFEEGVLKHHLVEIERIAPQCLASGNIRYYECAFCSNTYRDENARLPISRRDAVLSATGHTLEYVPEKRYCTKIGNIEHYRCVDCGLLFADSFEGAVYTEDDIKADPIGHEIALLDPREPTCVDYGYKIQHYGCTHDCYEEFYSSYVSETENTPITDLSTVLSDPTGVHINGDWVGLSRDGFVGYERLCKVCSEVLATISVSKYPSLSDVRSLSVTYEPTANGDVISGNKVVITAVHEGAYKIEGLADPSTEKTTYISVYNEALGSKYSSVNATTALSVYLNVGQNTLIFSTDNICEVPDIGLTFTPVVTGSRLSFAVQDNPGNFLTYANADNTAATYGEVVKLTDINRESGKSPTFTDELVYSILTDPDNPRDIHYLPTHEIQGNDAALPADSPIYIMRSSTFYLRQKVEVPYSGFYYLGGIVGDAGGSSSNITVSFMTYDETEKTFVDETAIEQIVLLTARGTDPALGSYTRSTYANYGMVYLDAEKDYYIRVKAGGIVCFGNLSLYPASHAHSYDGEEYTATAPTCGESGISETGHRCSLCNSINPEHYVAATGDHSYDAWKIDFTSSKYYRTCGACLITEYVSPSFSTRNSMEDEDYVDYDQSVTVQASDANAGKTLYEISVTAEKAGLYNVHASYTKPHDDTYFWMYSSALGKEAASLNLAYANGSSMEKNTLSVYLEEGENTVYIESQYTLNITKLDFYLLVDAPLAGTLTMDATTGKRVNETVQASDKQYDTDENGKWGREEILAAGFDAKNAPAGVTDGFGDPPVSFAVFLRGQTLYYVKKITVEKDGIYKIGMMGNAYNADETAIGDIVIGYEKDGSMVRTSLKATIGDDVPGVCTGVNSFGVVYQDAGYYAMKAGVEYTVYVEATGYWTAGAILLFDTAPN